MLRKAAQAAGEAKRHIYSVAYGRVPGNAVGGNCRVKP